LALGVNGKKRMTPLLFELGKDIGQDGSELRREKSKGGRTATVSGEGKGTM